MSEKAKLIKAHRGQGLISNINGFVCERCGLYFEVDMHLSKDNPPKFCPHCGAEFETEKTPNELNAKIKELYHEEKNANNLTYDGNGGVIVRGNVIDNEEEMEKLLDELTELANKNAK